LIQPVRWHVYANRSQLAAAATREIVNCARRKTGSSEHFRIVLAGGSTPRIVYSQLKHAACDLALWQVYFGDERCYPSGDQQRNETMARQAWLDHVPIPDQQIYPIATQLGAETAAADYARVVGDVPAFDLVLLGLGEDGHTASLFPSHRIGFEAHAPAAVPVHDAPKPPPDRVSLSAARLSQTNKLMFLITGEGKRAAVKRWRDGQGIPAARIDPASGVDVFITSDAAGERLS
jgi:6-phosphogluconolactonase